jgi:hypothetical protein
MPQGLLEGFERFSSVILLGIARHEREAQKFKTTLGLINQVLNTTHQMVVEKIERLEKAASIEEARSILEELNWQPLTESFRLEGLCDTFEGLGYSLGNLLNEAATSGAFSNEELNAVGDMAQTLTNRELEVSGIYILRIQELADLIADPGSDLDQLRRRAGEVNSLLTHQMSDFASKSRQFLRVGS